MAGSSKRLWPCAIMPDAVRRYSEGMLAGWTVGRATG